MSTELSPKARIFISCGQKDSDEVQTANEISDVVDDLGFEPILLLRENSFRGILENVFGAIQSAEYYLFVDFWRPDGPSVFSHQELAVAALTPDRQWALFQDTRWGENRPGLLQAVPSRIETFDDVRSLSSRVRAFLQEKLKRREWSTRWRRELRLRVVDPPPPNAYAPIGTKLLVRTDSYTGYAENWLTRYHQLEVRNLDRSKVAHNCVAFVEKLRDLTEDKDRPIALANLKWAGVTSPTVHIPPDHSWPLDIVRAPLPPVSLGALVAFNQFLTDWSGYNSTYALQPNHQYELQVVVYSDTFGPARIKLEVRFGNDSTALDIRSTDD